MKILQTTNDFVPQVWKDYQIVLLELLVTNTPRQEFVKNMAMSALNVATTAARLSTCLHK